MNIATLSLNINAPDFNYGAILHSWAFAKYLRKLSFVNDVTILNYTTPRLEGQDLHHPIKDCLKAFDLKRLLSLFLKSKEHEIKYQKFKSFIEDMPVSDKAYTQLTLSNENFDTYDAIIVESDVVWAPGFTRYKKEFFDKSFVLAFSNMDRLLKIAYAPSMANAIFSESEKKALHSLLEHFDAISCRESYEKPLLESLTGKRVEHVLDPVMLLDSSEYSSITARPLIPEKYLFLYLPVDNNITLRTEAKKYAEKHGLCVLEISTEYKQDRDCISLIDSGPMEFLSAIRNSEIVFTNSFHAICFWFERYKFSIRKSTGKRAVAG